MSNDCGLTVDQLVTEERVGKSAPHANVESPQALVTNLSSTESSIPVLSPVAGPRCKMKPPTLDTRRRMLMKCSDKLVA